jgi:hypothetical protein
MSEESDLIRWISVSDAAHVSGYHPEHLRKLLKAGKINGRKFATIWQVDTGSLLAYIHQVEKSGAKRGPKPGA